MSTSDISEGNRSSKDAALRAVGRTIVNFQRLEHNLKVAGRLRPLAGTLPQLTRETVRQSERAAIMPLGPAIQAWREVVEGEPSDRRFTPDLFDITVDATFSFNVEAEAHETHVAALKALLNTRNKLVHQDLVHFLWESGEKCEELIRDLDKVNDAIGIEIEFVASLLRAVESIGPDDIDVAEAAG